MLAGVVHHFARWLAVRALDRGQPFAIGEVEKREFKLDGFKWLKEESAENGDELPEPEELAAEALAELKDVFGELEQVLKLLGQKAGA
jgi:type I restriction enzyme M protein